MEKILNAKEYIESKEDATIELYIEYLDRKKNEAFKTYAKKLLEREDLREINKTIQTINQMQKSVEMNLALLLVSKTNEIDAENILDDRKSLLVDEIQTLLRILKTTGMEFISQEFIETLTTKVERITSVYKTIVKSDSQIAEKTVQKQFLERHIHSSELFRRAAILNDGILLSAFGSLSEPTKDFSEVEERRLTQFTTMIHYIQKLETIQQEYEDVMNNTTGFWEKKKKSYKESLASILETYQKTIQEVIEYFKNHPDILCITHSNKKEEIPKIETMEDLGKATDKQELSKPSRYDYMEVNDMFKEEDICNAFALVKVASTKLFQMERDENGFYQFNIPAEFRDQVIAAQKLLRDYYKEVYKRRVEREERTKYTSRLSEQEWQNYNTICTILGFAPASTEDIITGITTIESDITRLSQEKEQCLSEFVTLCEEKLICPRDFEVVINNHDNIERLYAASQSKETAKKEEKTNH